MTSDAAAAAASDTRPDTAPDTAPDTRPDTAPGPTVTVRYWAAAKAAAGVDADTVAATSAGDGPLTLAQVTARALAAHPGNRKLVDVLGCCSVLLDDRPVGDRDPESVVVAPGTTVQFLPPFAGG